jgi:multidrug resistance efflux pump
VQQPRSEELPPLIAKVAAAKAHLDDADDLLRRTNHLLASGAVAEEQSVRAEQQQRGALAELQAAQADLDLKRAGAWKLDTSVAEVAIAQAMANAERARVELDLQCARAPLTATVLRVDVRAGEFVAAGPAPLINLGVIQPLHVRVDFDEVDIPRIGPSAAAYARIRGTDGAPLVLRFVRIEPSVLPKKFFSGDSAERLDTRVLQVIYALDNAPDNAFVGQQVDVFAKARPRR